MSMRVHSTRLYPRHDRVLVSTRKPSCSVLLAITAVWQLLCSIVSDQTVGQQPDIDSPLLIERGYLRTYTRHYGNCCLWVDWKKRRRLNETMRIYVRWQYASPMSGLTGARQQKVGKVYEYICCRVILMSARPCQSLLHDSMTVSPRGKTKERVLTLSSGPKNKNKTIGLHIDMQRKIIHQRIR